MKRCYPLRPLLGVGALIIENNKALLVKRANPPGQGMWALPGGLVELGETLELALAREAREETGLMVKPLELVDVLEMILPDKQGQIEYHYVLFNYLCQALGRDLRAGGDAAGAAWFSIDDIDERVWPDTAGLVQRMLNGHMV